LSLETVVILPQLVERLRSARHIAVLTGAGISRESGIPTFREAESGLWGKFNPEEVATPDAFRRNPAGVWQWYEDRRAVIAGAQPNPGHHALAEIEARAPQFTLITQNIDGLHRAAGSRNVLELHGNIRRSRCTEEDVVLEDWGESDETPPRCPNCGALLRPDVVWFGEALPIEPFRAAIDAAQDADVFMSVGTSALVVPAASLPYEAVRCGADVVEVNPEDTPLTRFATYVLQGPGGEILPRLVAEAWP
jgi:NAD-dependent deacetylase